MNEEQLIATLQACYFGDKGAFNKILRKYKDLQQELTKYKERNENAIEYIKKYDVFKEFSFPLMKRDEENQVKSSIQYEFDTSIKKNLLEILEDKGE